MIKRVLAVAIIIGLLASWLFYKQHTQEPLRVSGFIEADEIRVGSRVGGRVASVVVNEGRAVKPGETLVTLEPFDLHERRAQGESELAVRNAEYARLQAGYRPEEIAQARARKAQLQAQLDLMVNGPRQEDIAAAQAQLDLSKAQLELARSEFKRAQSLHDRQILSQEDFDRAQSQQRVAEQTVQARNEEFGKLKRGNRTEDIEAARAAMEQADQALQLMTAGYRSEEVAQAKAQAEAAAAGLHAIDKQLSELTITAPVQGVIEAVDLRPGDLVSPNAPVISIMDTSRLWVRAYVPENLLGIRVDDKARLSVDSFPGEEFVGHISFIARQAEFTPGNVQTPEERSKQVFRIKVEIDEGRERLRPGMAADVWLEKVKGK